MKKFTKIALTAVLILVVAGGVLLGLGAAWGATGESLVKDMQTSRFVRNWMHRIDNWDEDDAWEEHDSYDDSHDDDWNDHGNGKHYSKAGDKLERNNNETVIDAAKVESLSVELLAGEAEIKVVSGSEIKISGLHNSDIVSYEENEKELDIFRKINHKNADGKLLIEIPGDKVFREFDISVSAGELKVSGKISAKESNITMEAGNFEAEFIDSEETDMECSAGNISVKFTGKLDDYCVDVEGSMGNLTLNEEHHAGIFEGTFGNADSLRTIDVECSAGNVEIGFENK